MVVLGKAGEERGREKLMAMGTERSKPLHNFELPCLKWGTRRFLRCIKGNPAGERVSSAFTGRQFQTEVRKRLIGVRRRERPGWIDEAEQSNRFSNWSVSSAEVEGGQKPNGGAADDDGIKAVREKLMFDLQTETEKIRIAILGEGLEDKREEQPQALPPAVEAEAAKPWNLRARRAASKALDVTDGSNSAGGGKRLKVDGGQKSHFSPAKSDSRSPRVIGSAFGNGTSNTVPEPAAGERPEFSVALARREIEEDFTAMVGHRPPRRPKKRSKVIQKRLDCLFPGLWLTEITPDLYSVADDLETGNR